MAVHSMLQPGRPGPHGLSQLGSPGSTSCQRRKSSGPRFLCSRFDSGFSRFASSARRDAVEPAVARKLRRLEEDIAIDHISAAVFDNVAVVSIICGMWSSPTGSPGPEHVQAVEVARKMASFSSRISAIGRPPWRFETMIMSSSMSVMFWTYRTSLPRNVR